MSSSRKLARTMWVVAAMLSLFFFVRPAAAQRPDRTKMLADFEDGTGGIFKTVRGTIGPTKDLDGKALTLKGGQNIAVHRPTVNWSGYNFIIIDTYNPTDAPVRLHLCFKDDSAPHGYYSWINRYVSVKPGRSTVELCIPELRRGEGSPKDMLDTRPFHWDKLQWLGIKIYKGNEVQIDNIRLAKLEVSVPKGVQAFDFGPAGSPLFLGTAGVSPETVYDDANGYGWTRKRTIYTRKRHSAPDTFVQDWISGNNSTFSVKVPNGKVHVWLMWADPGEWELVQHHAWRNIQAEGRKVLDDKMTGEQFLDFYFHFAETEDLPGEDIYKKYVMWRYRPSTFTVNVADGRLDLTINGPDQYACTVNGLVVYPDSKKKEAERYIAGLMKRRREAFYKTWTEKKPKKGMLPADLAGSSFRYRVSRSRDVHVYDAPTMEEIQAALEPVEISAARGEYEPFAFTVYALVDLPKLAASIEEFKTDDGVTLPASAFDIRVVRYKFKRIGFAGAGVYGIQPWILVDGRESSVKKGLNRRYWITVHVPKDQPAGVYKGKVRMETTLGGTIRSWVRVTVRVLPFELPDADMGLGMFGMGNPAPYFPYFPENRERNEADRKRSLAFAREQGFTYIALQRGITFKGFQDGKAQYDFSKALAHYQRAKKLGFSVIDVYGEKRMARQALDDKGPLAKKHGFATPDELVKAVFTGAIEGAKAVGLPEPVWSFGDEPPDSQAPVFVNLHRRMRELAGAKSEISWSPDGEPTHELLDVTSACSLNITNIEDIQRAKAHGNVIYLNNQGRSRWAYGLYMWKAHQAGVQAYQQFCWMGTHADPYYPLDSYEDDGGHVYPDRQGNLRPKVDLERIREGIDDYRYTLALTRAIEKAKTGSDAQKKSAAEAQAYLDGIFNKLKFEDTRRDKRPQMTEAQLDVYRAKVQEYLLKLTQ